MGEAKRRQAIIDKMKPRLNKELAAAMRVPPLSLARGPDDLRALVQQHFPGTTTAEINEALRHNAGGKGFYPQLVDKE